MRVSVGKHSPGNDLGLGLSLESLGRSPQTNPGWSKTSWEVEQDEIEHVEGVAGYGRS